MKIELSALFGVKHLDKAGLDVHIGGGVFVQEILSNGVLDGLFESIKKNDRLNYDQLIFRGDNENSVGRYSHRFFLTYDGSPSFRDKAYSKAFQLLGRAIVLSRVVKPLPIPLHTTLICNGNEGLKASIPFGFYSTAYIRIPRHRETITVGDANRMASLWSGSQRIYEHPEKYVRVNRALLAFNDAYHIDPIHLAHIVLHSALETLICTSRNNNRKQVTKRLPQMVEGLSEAEAIDIYDYCCGVKHAAEPSLLSSPNIFDLQPEDARRVVAATNLDDALRRLFIKAFEDQAFADLLENKRQLEFTFPV